MKGCAYTYPPLSIARYSFIQLSELEQCRVKKLSQGFNTAAQDSNPGSLSQESGGLPLSHCVLQNCCAYVCTVTMFYYVTPLVCMCVCTGVDRWGTGGDASPPLFRVGGQHRNCPPHFSVQKNCEAYSLTQHSSLLKAAT